MPTNYDPMDYVSNRGQTIANIGGKVGSFVSAIPAMLEQNAKWKQAQAQVKDLGKRKEMLYTGTNSLLNELGVDPTIRARAPGADESEADYVKYVGGLIAPQIKDPAIAHEALAKIGQRFTTMGAGDQVKEPMAARNMLDAYDSEQAQIAEANDPMLKREQFINDSLGAQQQSQYAGIADPALAREQAITNNLQATKGPITPDMMAKAAAPAGVDRRMMKTAEEYADAKVKILPTHKPSDYDTMGKLTMDALREGTISSAEAQTRMHDMVKLKLAERKQHEKESADAIVRDAQDQGISKEGNKLTEYNPMDIYSNPEQYSLGTTSKRQSATDQQVRNSGSGSGLSFAQKTYLQAQKEITSLQMKKDSLRTQASISYVDQQELKNIDSRINELQFTMKTVAPLVGMPTMPTNQNDRLDLQLGTLGK
jgi:RNA-binding protein YhbY